MKNHTLKLLFGISIAISIIGFILDFDERVENVYLNLFEIAMMTLIIFGILAGITKTIQFVQGEFRTS